MIARRVVAFVLGVSLAGMAAQAHAMSDAQVRQRIIRESVANFHSACPCPYSKIKDRKGRLLTCGSRSEYHREGTDIRCYPKDVSDTDVDAWRSDHGR